MSGEGVLIPYTIFRTCGCDADGEWVCGCVAVCVEDIVDLTRFDYIIGIG